MGWWYYAYVVAVVLTAMVDNVVEQVVCAVVFHCLAIMFVYAPLLHGGVHPSWVSTSVLATDQGGRGEAGPGPVRGGVEEHPSQLGNAASMHG